MYCRYCGKTINKEDSFCIHCGAQTGVKPLNQSKPKKGKGIASMILGILAVLYTLGALSINFEIEFFNISFVLSDLIGYIIGIYIVELSLAIISISLSLSERKKFKNGFNTSGFWLSIAAFILMIVLGFDIFFAL